MTSNLKTKKISIPKGVFEQIFMQNGGQAHKAMTGEYILPHANEEEVNAEIEKGEFVQDSSGIKQALGDTHENGGTKVVLEDGAKVLSDHLKITAKVAKQLNDKYDLGVKASDTYSKVLDRYNKKSGLDKINTELEKYIKKLEEQNKNTKDENTLALNTQYLTEEINEEFKEKEPLEKQREVLFNELFEIQESAKEEKGESNEFQLGGQMTFNGDTVIGLANKYNIDMDKAKELIAKFKNGSYQNGGSFVPKYQDGKNPLTEWASQQSFKPEYELGNLEETAIRFKELADNAGVKYTEEDFKNLDNLNTLAGKIQQKIIKDTPELAYDYGLSVEPTRQGLQYLVDNKLIDPKEIGINLINGKVPRGSYDTLTEENQNLIQGKLKTLPDDKKKEYATTNFNDNLAFFRGVLRKDGELPKEEYDRFLETNKDKIVGDSGYFKTDVPGVYIRPTTAQQNTPNQTTAPAQTTTPPPVLGTPPINADTRARLGFLPLPDQSPLPPSAQAQYTPLQARGTYIDPVYVSPEQQLVEFDRSRVSAEANLNMLPSAQAAAVASQLNANTNAAASKAIGEVNRYNAQAQESSNRFNAQLDTALNREQNQYDLQYKNLTEAARDKTEQDWRNYYNRLNQNNVNNWMYVETANRSNALNPDVQFTGFGYEINKPDLSQSASVQQMLRGANTPTENLSTKKKPTAKKGGRFKK
jgi:hypothetical protein